MEPGEASTVFTMFGTDTSKALGPDRLDDSEGDTVGGGRGCKSDLCLGGTCLSVPPQQYPRNCTAGDYKEWYVALPQDSVNKRSRHCVQGRREVFQRRASKANCYDGN